MQNTDTLFDEIRNVGYIDRGIRIIAGFGAILFVLTTQTVGMLGWMAIIPLLAVYPIMTGLVSYDPLYAWAQIDTSKSSIFSDANVIKLFNHISDNHTDQSSKPAVSEDHETGHKAKHQDAA